MTATDQPVVPSLDEWLDTPPDEFLVAVRDGAEGRFRVTTREQLAWVMRKVAGVRAEIVATKDLAASNMEQIVAWLQLALSPLEASEEFFASLARGFLIEQVREQVPDWDGGPLDADAWKLVRTKTYKTPKGDAAVRRSNGKFGAPDDDKQLASTLLMLDTIGRADLVYEPRSVRAKELKAAVDAGTARVVDGHYEVLAHFPQTCDYVLSNEAGEEWSCPQVVVTRHAFGDADAEDCFTCEEHNAMFDQYVDHTAEPYTEAQWVRLDFVTVEGEGELRFELHTAALQKVERDVEHTHDRTREVAVEAGR